MSSNPGAAQTGSEIDSLKAKLQATWMTGDYDRFSRFMEADAKVFYERLGVPKGARLLDAACGSGQVALIAARQGADVSGCDIASNWIERARERAAAEGLQARFDVGDAEALPYGDASFDVIVSLVGVMFAPRPELVASELIRVCRPGGRIALGNWTPEGFIGQMFKAVAKHIAPPGMPSPVLWGKEDVVRERLGKDGIDVQCSREIYHFDYPFSPEGVVEFFRINYGPVTRAFAALDAAGQAALRSELTALWAGANKTGGERTQVDAEYLLAIATKA